MDVFGKKVAVTLKNWSLVIFWVWCGLGYDSIRNTVFVSFVPEPLEKYLMFL